MKWWEIVSMLGQGASVASALTDGPAKVALVALSGACKVLSQLGEQGLEPSGPIASWEGTVMDALRADTRVDAVLDGMARP